MLRVHFVRHGDVHNPEQIFYGRRPGYPLSEKGHKQAKFVGTQFKDKNIIALYSSPLLRTMQTAGFIKDVTQSTLPIKEHELLLEVNLPYYEGKSWEYCLKNNWKIPEDEQPANEGLEQTMMRAVKFVEYVKEKYFNMVKEREHVDVIAVTHGGVALAAQMWGKFSKEESGLPTHCSITTFHFKSKEEEIPSLITYYDTCKEMLKAEL